MCLGIPGQIVEITDFERKMAVVDISGVRRPVSVVCVGDDIPLESLIGKWTLVHVGFAMSLIDEKEAEETLKALHELGEVQQELETMRETQAMMRQQK